MYQPGLMVIQIGVVTDFVESAHIVPESAHIVPGRAIVIPANKPTESWILVSGHP